MTKDEVRQKMELFFLHLHEEQELREELCSLKFTNVSEAEVREAMGRQRQILKQLDAVHKQKMLPIVSEMAQFVGAKQAELFGKPAPAKAAPKAAARKSPGGR